MPADQRRPRFGALSRVSDRDARAPRAGALHRPHPDGGRMTKIALELTINGERHEVATDPQRTLLDVLRVDLGMTGTKENCLEAECGVCTVLVDGRAVNACILLAAQCQ